MIYSKEVVLILVDTLAVAFPVALAFTSVLALTISFALCTEVVAEHGTEDKVLFGCELVQRTGDDEPYGLQTLAPSEVHIQVLLACGLQHVGDALALQSLYGLLTIFLITGEQHHLSHALIQFVDVVHQHLHFSRNCSCCHR